VFQPGGLAVAIVVLLATGCARRAELDASSFAAGPARGTGAPPQTAAPAGAGPAPAVVYPVVTPVTSVQGRVVSVNNRLRFVIADFAFQQMPQPNQRLGVFRAGQRVGEVRISGPFDGTVVIADIMSGGAEVSDLLRAE
jgi:hypothetical protein